MTQLDTACAISLTIAYLFGGPFIVAALPAMITGNAFVLRQLIPIGYTIFGFCCLIPFIGAWLDGFCN